VTDSGVVSKAEYARMRGVSDAYVSKLRRKGRLVLTDDGRVRVAESDALIARTRDPSRGGKRSPGELGAPLSTPAAAWTAKPEASAPEPLDEPAGPPASEGGAVGGVVNAATYAEAQRLHKIELVRKTRLANAKEAGALVLADEVRRLAFNRSRAAQAALLSIPDRLCLSLAAEAAPDRCHALLLAEMRKVCGELAGTPATTRTSDEAAA
jgi:hypothetical protein